LAAAGLPWSFASNYGAPHVWPFNRKSLDISTLSPISNADSKWSLSIFDDEDGPLLIRLNHSALPWSGHPTLPIKLGFAIPLAQPYPGGLPDGEENKILSGIEDLVESRVQETTIGIHVLTNTNGIMKEFIFYIPEGVDIKTLHESLDDSVSTHDVQCIAEREPKWDTFTTFSKLAATGKQVT
jgi:hypothetical protein